MPSNHVQQSRRIAVVLSGLLVLLSSGYGSTGNSLELVRNGHSAYRIALSGKASEIDKKAAGELQKYLNEISGVSLPIITAPDHSGDSLIWVGSAGHVQDFPARLDWENFEDAGFCIRTEGTNLIIAGGKVKGSLYGVYSFLEKYLGCRKFSPTVEVIPKRKTITLHPIDDTQVPALKSRRELFYEPGYADWLKLESYTDNWGLFVHTFSTLVPPEEYFKDHPEYFSKGPSGRVPDAQLCLTNPDVLTIVIKALKKRIQENPESQFWSVSQNDTFGPCECDECKKINDEEGSPSGSLLAFINKVADEFPDKTISTLAYEYSRAAPKHIKPRKNVNIMLCSIECNRSRSIEADTGSRSFVKDVVDWTNLTSNIFLWDYVVQFSNYVSPFPNFRVLQPNIRFFVKHGITSVFEEGNSALEGEFVELRSYLIAKLLWNPDLNVDSVINDFLKGYYGKAAPYLRRYIDTMHDALELSGENLSIYGSPLPSKTGYLSPKFMKKYVQLFDQAEAAVRHEPVILERVQAARLPLQFAQIEQAKAYGVGERGFYTVSKDGTSKVRPAISALLQTFVERCKRAGIHCLVEGGLPPDQYLERTEQRMKVTSKKHLAMFKPVTLTTPAHPRYRNGDGGALTDGLKGWEDFHMNWLGWQGEDMEAVIDLGRPAKISTISTDFLQNGDASIFLPLDVEYAVSDDGRNYRQVALVKNEVSERKEGAFIHSFSKGITQQRARYIRVKASNMKTCPPWHRGAGGPAWIFADEIVVE